MAIPREQYERITAEMSQMKMAQGGDVRSMIDDEMRMRKVCKAHNCSIDQYRQAKKTYGDGGNIAKENRDMVANNNKQIAHHTKELEKALGDGKSVPAWVVAKVNRSASDLSDVTHYLDGSEEKMAKGGNVHYFQDKDSHRMGRPNSIDNDLLNKVGYESFKDDFVGNFGWMTSNKKLADGYLFKLDSFDQNLVKDIKLKSGERIFRYFNERSAIGGIVPLIKINLEKGLLYFMPMKEFGDDSIEFETKGVKAEWVNLIEDKMAKGGEIEKHVDLIEHYEQMPPKIAKIFDKYWKKYGEDMDYGIIAKMHDEVYKQGYTFESGLDATIYGLRPIGVKLNQLEGYEDVNESSNDEPFEKGGNIQIGDWVAEKKGTAIGQVYYDFGEFVKLQDKYGNQSNTLYSKRNLKKSFKPRYDVGGNIPSWLFIGTYPNAYIYADNRFETRGEYHRIGAVYFNPLSYVIKDNSPKYKEVHDMIINEYEMMKGKESVKVSLTGQTAPIREYPEGSKTYAYGLGFRDDGYAKGGTTRKEYIANKVGKVMHEFKEGELHSGSGAKVTDRKQAIAIGLSDGRKGWKHRSKK
jgi:hypothetical protein